MHKNSGKFDAPWHFRARLSFPPLSTLFTLTWASRSYHSWVLRVALALSAGSPLPDHSAAVPNPQRSMAASTGHDSVQERDDDAETDSHRLGVVSFVRRGQPLSGLFQQRYCDFHVHELERPGQAVHLLSLPGRADVPALPDAAAGIEARVLQFVLYKENRTTTDALQQLASAASIPLAALRVAGTANASEVERWPSRQLIPVLLRRGPRTHTRACADAA